MTQKLSMFKIIESQLKNIVAGLIITMVASFVGWVAISIYNSYISPAQKKHNAQIEAGMKSLVVKDSIRSIQDIRTQAKTEIIISGQVASEKKIDKLQESIEKTNDLIISVLREKRIGIAKN